MLHPPSSSQQVIESAINIFALSISLGMIRGCAALINSINLTQILYYLRLETSPLILVHSMRKPHTYESIPSPRPLLLSGPCDLELDLPPTWGIHL